MVRKSVIDDTADPEKEFTFVITLGDTSINGTYGDMTFTDGVATFTLKDGESKTASGLPAGIGYTVSEDSVSAAGYEVEMTGAVGIIEDGVTAEADFVNTRRENTETTPYIPKPIGPTEEPEEPTELPDPETPLNEDPGDTDDPEDIEDPEELDDPEIPLADVPYTGDSFALYMLFLCAAFVSIATLKRSKDEEKQ